MMRVLIFVVLFLSFMGFAGAADDTSVLTWWNSLSQQEQLKIQTDLVLTGHYEALVDAEIGPATIAALRAFQRQAGGGSSGALTTRERAQLSSEATGVFSQLGMKLIEDDETGVSTFVPLALVEKVESSEGVTTYRSQDQELALLLLGAPSEGATIETVRSVLTERKDGREITYVSTNLNRVIVAGVDNGVKFYTYLALAGPRLLGYSVTWTTAYEYVGRMLAVLAASYTFPIDSSSSAPANVPREDGPNGRTYADVGERVGSFVLPSSLPDRIVLDGEIGDNAALDFLRALKRRPGATTLSLNSPGGLVGIGLLVAHEVQERGLNTEIADGYGCYSACAYIFFAGRGRSAFGELGVHQVYGDRATVATAQSTLSDVLDALAEFGVEQEVISLMLRTPPEQMYVFSHDELVRLGINRSEPTLLSAKPKANVEMPAISSGSPLSEAESLVSLIKACMHVPAGALEAHATTRLQVEIENGRIVSGPRALISPTTDLETQMMIAGMRAIDDCAPYPSTFSGVVSVTFDPSEL